MRELVKIEKKIGKSSDNSDQASSGIENAGGGGIGVRQTAEEVG